MASHSPGSPCITLDLGCLLPPFALEDLAEQRTVFQPAFPRNDRLLEAAESFHPVAEAFQVPQHGAGRVGAVAGRHRMGDPVVGPVCLPHILDGDVLPAEMQPKRTRK